MPCFGEDRSRRARGDGWRFGHNKPLNARALVATGANDDTPREHLKRFLSATAEE